ncbi:MAG: hypothetical protein ACYTFQ_17000 [Planctomycetota bacterium]
MFGKEEEYVPDPKPVVEGDEAEPEEVEPEEPEEEPEEEATGFVEVEFEGQLYEVPEQMKDALMREGDYTQKTQALSADRKALEVHMQEVREKARQFDFANSVWDDSIKVQQLDETAKQWQEYLRTNLDNLSSTDIEKVRFQIEELNNEKGQLANTIRQKYAESQQAQEQSYQELLKKGTEVLRQRIPGWDEAKQKGVKDFALAQGFTEAEMASLVDPRHVEVLYMASQFKALKDGAVPAVRKVSEAIKPKSRNPMPDQVKQKLNLRKKLKSKNVSNADKAKIIGESLFDSGIMK